MVELLSLAHDRACEAELAAILTTDLDAHRLPDLKELRSALCAGPGEPAAGVRRAHAAEALRGAERRVHGSGGMKDTIDTTRLTLLLNELRLPAIKHLWEQFAERSDKEGWPAARLLMALAEHEIAERDRRRIERHLGEAKLLPGKTLENFDFAAVPMISKAQVSALCAGDGWLEKGANLLLFGPPGGGKSHLASAIGLSLIEKGWRVLFTRTSDLVQKLQLARRELVPRGAIQSLDRYHLLILGRSRVRRQGSGGNLRAVRVDQRSIRAPLLLITANQPFGEWGKVFQDPAMTLAAVDRLVHHATIFEMNVDSYDNHFHRPKS
jgi:DNA replication protein DnaC